MKLPQVKRKNKSHKSTLETAVLRVLKKLLRNLPRIRIKYETETLEYIKVGKYTPDFILHYPDGSKVYIEAKGYFRPADRAKMLAVKRNNPDKDIRIVFAQNNKMGKRMRYTDWAKKYNFPCAVGEVPKEWFK